MASGGGPVDTTGGGDVTGDFNAADIEIQTRIIAETYYNERLEADKLNDFKKIKMSSTGTPQDMNLKMIGHMLKDAGDKLDDDVHYQTSKKKLNIEDPEGAYVGVMKELFKDGVYTWGRVVMLFAFGYDIFKQAYKAGHMGMMGGLSLLKKLVEILIRFITQNLASWISTVGGWMNFHDSYSSNTRQMALIAGGALLTAIFLYYRMR